MLHDISYLLWGSLKEKYLTRYEYPVGAIFVVQNVNTIILNSAKLACYLVASKPSLASEYMSPMTNKKLIFEAHMGVHNVELIKKWTETHSFYDIRAARRLLGIKVIEKC